MDRLRSSLEVAAGGKPVKRILGAIVFVVACTIAPVPVQSGQEKVTICHIPPGNPENRHTIVVAAPAVQAHVELHGDTIGECGGDPG
jgi:hypothetical protein